MRITAISAGVLSCALIFAINDGSVSAAAPVQLALNESPSLIENIADQTSDKDKEQAPQPKEDKKPVVITHTIAKGESLSKIAKEYKEEHDTTWKRIFDKNTEIKDPDVIAEGDKIVIPRADEKLTERELPAEPVVAVTQQPVAQATPAPAPQATPAAADCDEATQWVRADNGQCIDKPGARRSTASSAAPAPAQRATTPARPAATAPRGATSGNLYSYGYCTWYVKNRRPDLPNNLGNADTWLSRARAQGYATGSTPRVGAVAYALTGYMHVAYVTAVHGNGTVTVSEMNFKGWNVTSTRTVPASQFAYIY